MFTSRQIISASKLIKNFTEISKDVSTNPQAILITQKSRASLVLVDAETYEQLLYQHYENAMAASSDDLYE
jgi:PHD/YefM family antitoxin component YafN of YafNO toxin-antitoxin module